MIISVLVMYKIVSYSFFLHKFLFTNECNDSEFPTKQMILYVSTNF